MTDAVSRDAVLDILSDEGWLGDSLRRISALPAVQPDALIAERDRLREALEHIISDCEADYPPSHGAIKYEAKLALKGESHD